MAAAAERLKTDPRIRSVKTETKAEAYERAKALFKDDPELLDALTPDTMPASVELTVGPDVDTKALVTELNGSLAGANDQP